MPIIVFAQTSAAYVESRVSVQLLDDVLGLDALADADSNVDVVEARQVLGGQQTRLEQLPVHAAQAR